MPDTFRGISGNDGKRGHIMGHYGTCPDHGSPPYRDSRKYDRVSSDPHVFSDGHAGRFVSLGCDCPVSVVRSVIKIRYKTVRGNKRIVPYLYIFLGHDLRAFINQYIFSDMYPAVKTGTDSRIPADVTPGTNRYGAARALKKYGCPMKLDMVPDPVPPDAKPTDIYKRAYPGE
jgi:hypothetical protein